MNVLMVDNYDSFTYNIVQYFGELGAQVEVHRNDEITVAEIQAKLDAGQLDRLVISPGPCSPAEAGISVAAIQHFAGQLPILGVCLGHQSIGAAFSTGGDTPPLFLGECQGWRFDGPAVAEHFPKFIGYLRPEPAGKPPHGA